MADINSCSICTAIYDRDKEGNVSWCPRCLKNKNREYEEKRKGKQNHDRDIDYFESLTPRAIKALKEYDIVTLKQLRESGKMRLKNFKED